MNYLTLACIAILVMIAATCGNRLYAQQKKFNYEFGASYNVGNNTKQSTNTDPGFGGYFEWRYNYRTVPLDFGLLLDLATFGRDGSATHVGNLKIFNVLLAGDYILRRGSKIEPFAGLGMGVTFANHGGVFNPDFATKLCAMPRIGARFVRHVSISMDYTITHKDLSALQFRLGFYF